MLSYLVNVLFEAAKLTLIEKNYEVAHRKNSDG